MKEIIVVQDAPKSERMLHYSVELLQLLNIQTFCLRSLRAVLYRVIQYIKRDSRYTDLNYQYLFTFVWVCACSSAEMFLEFDFWKKKCIAWFICFTQLVLAKTAFYFCILRPGVTGMIFSAIIHYTYKRYPMGLKNMLRKQS